ncbi:MAG: hypothetical protein ACOYKE_03925 [Ferruginibacter sp.]
MFKSSIFCLISFCILNSACNNNNTSTSASGKYGEDVLSSTIVDADSLNTFDFVQQRVNDIKAALQKDIPILLCSDTLNAPQQAAQAIAITDPTFTANLRQPETKLPYRSEIFGIYPARESDMTSVKKGSYQLANCFRIEMYNYPLNLTTIAIADIQQKKVLTTSTLAESQPDIPAKLKQLAIKIAIESAEVQSAYGFKPSEKEALMASTKTSLNRTRCERSRHLCVAPTFVKDGKALWAIVDLTDHKLVGVRWTNVGNSSPAPIITERKLQDEKITACFCEAETRLEKDDWKMDYMITSSDGLRIAAVSYKGKPVLQSAKLVDWHVSYSGTDGFGYSDAVGCPYFSQAAVIAFQPPKVAQLKNDQNEVVGFALEQVFKSELWPAPCNYNYRQRYEFYKDGRFRIAAASIGRGCGNDGTYRPVFRIAFADEQQNFAEWNGTDWTGWSKEKWQLQNASTLYTKEGYQYKIAAANGAGYYMEPGQGQFNDGGRGDNAYVYVTKNKFSVDEGEADLIMIGPCCNTDYHQGPEKFIEPTAEDITSSKLVVWYVAQMKNDNTKGKEYCWAESTLENGVYSTRIYPCFCGPMFIPIR